MKFVLSAGTDGRYVFEPTAIETLGVLSTSARRLFGGRIAQVLEEARETSFLFHRCSVLVQHFNAVLLYDSLPVFDCTDDFIHFLITFKHPSGSG